ncbi:MAG: hypothetical protein LBM02_03380 [Lachnospiraceae bacterium]|nr:hypothetical protein [Lachnospiraceae bacterium]
MPKETKSITVNASDESLDASLFVYTSDAIEVKLVDASKYVYEPIIKKKGKKKEFEFWYLKPGAQYTLITKNNKNTVVFEQIAIKDVLSSIS